MGLVYILWKAVVQDPLFSIVFNMDLMFEVDILRN